MAKLNGFTGFLLGFAAVTGAKVVAGNVKDAMGLMDGNFEQRELAMMQGTETALYEDWKKFGPRWQNGYYVPPKK